MRSVTLHCQEGTSDKVYTVQLESVAGKITVTGFGGRRGGTMKAYPKYSGTNAEQAETEYKKLIQSKLSGGYKVADEGAAAQPVAPVAGPVQAVAADDGFKPMLLNPIEPCQSGIYIESPDWVMQQKADGVRAIARVSAAEVVTTSRTGKPVVISKAADEILRRDFAGCVIDLEVIGQTVVVLDVLVADGKDIRKLSTADRLAALDMLYDAPPTGRAVVKIQTAFTESQKRAALAILHESGAEGVVFKRKSAPYVAGRPSSGGNGLKWKFKASATLRVQAVGVDGKDSIAVALEDGTKVASCSTIGKPVPKVGQLVEVEYLYAYRGGSIVQAVYKAVRTDKKKADSADSLQYKGEER